MFVFGIKTPLRLLRFRIALFNSLFIDYLAFTLRTLAHYPAQVSRRLVDSLSYSISIFTVLCFAGELILMLITINDPRTYQSNKKQISPSLKSLKEVYYEGISEEALQESWFARNYNFLYLVRFAFLVIFLINLQYLQILQIFFSLALMTTMTVASLYYQFNSKAKIFEGRVVGIVRMILECSINIIIALIAIFCIDSFTYILSLRFKLILVILFLILLVLNIMLEMGLIVGPLIGLIYRRVKKGHVIPDAKNKRVEVGKVLDMPQPKDEKNGSTQGTDKPRIKFHLGNRQMLGGQRKSMFKRNRASQPFQKLRRPGNESKRLQRKLV